MTRVKYNVWHYEYSHYHFVQSFSTAFNAIKYLYNIFSDDGTDDEYDVHDIDIRPYEGAKGTMFSDHDTKGIMFRYRGLIYVITVDKEYGYEEV